MSMAPTLRRCLKRILLNGDLDIISGGSTAAESIKAHSNGLPLT